MKKKRRTGRRVKSKFIFTYQFLFIIIFLVTMIILSITLNLPSSSEIMAGIWKDTLNQNTKIKEISYDGLKDKIGRKDAYFFVYYGTPSDETSKKDIKELDKIIDSFSQIPNSKQFDVYWLNSDFLNKYEDKSSKEFKDMINQKQNELQVKDLSTHSAFFSYNNGVIVDDYTAGDYSGVGDTNKFPSFVNQSFSKYINLKSNYNFSYIKKEV